MASDGSIYGVDYSGYCIRRISKEGTFTRNKTLFLTEIILGITATVAGFVASPTVDFVPGVGSNIVFCGTPAAGPAEIIEHPRAPGFFYIADNCGIRVLCMFPLHILAFTNISQSGLFLQALF